MQNTEYEYRGAMAQFWDLLRGDTSNWEDKFFYQTVIAESGQPVLDIGCGTGRLLLDYMSQGIDIDGVDNSPEMLALCRQKAQPLGIQPNLYQQTMETLDLPRKYRMILVPSSSFQLLTDPNDAAEAMRRFLQHLEPGGILAMSFMTLSTDGEGPFEWQKEVVRPDDGAVVRRWSRSRFDLVNHLEHTEDRYDVIVNGEVVASESLSRSPATRSYTQEQVVKLYEAAGFTNIRVCHGFSFEPAAAQDSVFPVLGTKPRKRFKKRENMTRVNQQQTGFAELNGTKFYYEMAGAGQPLVLVHAGIADCSMWDEQFHVFAQHYQVIRYDMRGYGQTALVDQPYAHYQDLAALLDFLHIQQAHVLGCSFGGATALDFTLAYPQRVLSLIAVTCRPEGYMFTSAPPPQLDAMEAAFQTGDFEQLSELEVQMWVDGPTRTPDQVDAALRNRVRAMNGVALKNEALELGQPQPLDPPAAQRLPEISAPTLVISGALDRSVMLSAAGFMAQTIPNARKVVITGTAHLPSMEQPDLFNRTVLDFLNQQA